MGAAVYEHFIKCVFQWEHLAAVADMYDPSDARVIEARLTLANLLARFELKDLPP